MNFEELDQQMMDFTKTSREKSVPKKELENFNSEVMKKIARFESEPPDFNPLLISISLFCFLIMVSGMVFIHSVETGKIHPKKLQFLLPAPAAAMTHETIAVKLQPVPAPQVPPAVIPAAVSSQPAQGQTVRSLNEEELIAEIEALRELGVWTEEDEEQAGMPVEVTFAETELFIEQTSVVTPGP
jgi:hypothetical protein